MTDYSRFPSLLIEQRGDGILRITFNRPEKMNAVSREGYHELATIWPVIAEDRDTRAVLVTGAGRAFSSGGDIGWVNSMMNDMGHMYAFLKDAMDIVRTMTDLDKPIISAINGPASGAGLAVAMMSDITLMAEEAFLFSGQIHVGIAVGDHALVNWPLLASLAKVKYYLLTGDPLDGREAARIGLVSRCVPGESLLPEAEAVARRLADGPQAAQQWTKRALGNWIRRATPHFHTVLAMEGLSFKGPDAKEGFDAIRQKRPANFPSAQE